MTDPKWEDTEEIQEVPTFEDTEEVITAEPTTLDRAGQTLSDFSKGIGQGASLGFADELAGAVGALIPEPTDNVDERLRELGFTGDIGSEKSGLESLAEKYREARDFARAEQERAKERSPIATTVGEIAGGFAVPGLGAAGQVGKAATTGTKVLKGIQAGSLMGGLTGLGTSEADLTKGELGKAAVDVGIGTAGGAALGGAIPMITPAGVKLKKIGDTVVEAAETLPIVGAAISGLKTGVKAGLRGQLLTEEATSELTEKTAKELRNAIYDELKKNAKSPEELQTLLDDFNARISVGDDVTKVIEDIAGEKALTTIAKQEKEAVLESLKELAGKAGEDLDKLDLNNLTVDEARSFLSELNRFTGFGEKGKNFPQQRGAIKQLAGQIREKIANVSEAVDEQTKKLHKLLTAREFAGLKPRKGASGLLQEAKDVKKISSLLSGASRGSRADQKAFFKMLKDVNPERFKQFENEADFITKLNEAVQQGTDLVSWTGIARGVGAVANIPTYAATKTAQAAKSLAKSGLAKAQKKLGELTSKKLQDIALKMKQNGQEQFSRVLNKIAESSTEREKNALLFGLYQQPAFRKIMEDELPEIDLED